MWLIPIYIARCVVFLCCCVVVVIVVVIVFVIVLVVVVVVGFVLLSSSLLLLSVLLLWRLLYRLCIYREVLPCVLYMLWLGASFVNAVLRSFCW